MRTIFVFFGLLAFYNATAQNIFSQTDIEYKKLFAPYETQNLISLDDQEMILLLEAGKGKFRLVRYDKYFFDKWNVFLDFKKEGGFPQLFQIGDGAVIFRCWTEKHRVVAEVRIYDIASGTLKSQHKKTIVENNANTTLARVTFSEDHRQFVLHNFLSADGSRSQFDVFELDSLNLKASYALESNKTRETTAAVFLADHELFVALADAGSFTLDTYFFSKTAVEPVSLSSSYSFRRPVENIPAVKVQKQSESTFLVVVPACIENELLGINISSFNVVLKSVIYSKSFDLDEEFIKNSYSQSIFTSENQRKKHVTRPGNLEGFHLQEVIIDTQGGITCIFEDQEWKSRFHENSMSTNQLLKWKQPEDLYYFNEDLMFINFTTSGEMSWKKVIQKTQYSKAMGHTLSYLSEVENDELKLVMQENAKGNSVYTCTIDLLNGGVVNVKSFFDKKLEINKNYSGWINDNTLLICAYPEVSKKRSLYLVEF